MKPKKLESILEEERIAELQELDAKLQAQSLLLKKQIAARIENAARLRDLESKNGSDTVTTVSHTTGHTTVERSS